jgi:hypothetical protein
MAPGKYIFRNTVYQVRVQALGSNDMGWNLRCVTLGKLFNLSEPYEMENEDIKNIFLEKSGTSGSPQ